MTDTERDSVLTIFRAAAKDPKRARHIMGRQDITAEQAETIMHHLADIFEIEAKTNPDILMREAIDRAVSCTQTEIKQIGLSKLHQILPDLAQKYHASRG